MTIGLTGLFLLIFVCTVAHLYRNYRHLIAKHRPRVHVFDPEKDVQDWLEQQVRR